MTMFRPAKRENTPLIIGLAGPTKSGKTYSAHRLARGLCEPGKLIAMINAEGPRGHQYADKFMYLACDVAPPYRPESYEAPVRELIARQEDIGCLIIDSMSHMHDGPGGMLEWHDEIAQKMAERGSKTEAERQAKLERVTWSGWIPPKKAENQFIYRLLELACPVILCFRAKEKIKIVPGKPPIDLGWQPIASDRVAFETLFTLVLPPHSKGVPELEICDMREPFDTMVAPGKQIDEQLGERLRAWAAGAPADQQPAAPQPAESERPARDAASAPSPGNGAAGSAELISDDDVLGLDARCFENGINVEALKRAAGVARLSQIKKDDLPRARAWIDAVLAKRKTAQAKG